MHMYEPMQSSPKLKKKNAKVKNNKHLYTITKSIEALVWW